MKRATIGVFFPLCLLLSVACSSDVLVGEGAPGSAGSTATDPECPGCSEVPPPYVASGECAAEDEKARLNYETWRRQKNDFGQFADSEWQGYVDNGPDLRLVIAKDGTAFLETGDKQETPTASDGFLCPNPNLGGQARSCDFLTPGASYALHGGTAEGNRLTVPFHPQAALEPWCALQTAYPHPYEGPEMVPEGAELEDSCNFSASENLSTGIVERPQPDEVCLLGEEEVLCSWMAQTQNCACASDGCFPGIWLDLNDDVDLEDQLDLTYNEGDETFIGTLSDTYLANGIEPAPVTNHRVTLNRVR